MLNINRRVSSDEKWKNNKTVKQMNGNGKDKHVSIINKANNTKENKERILKKRNLILTSCSLPPLTMLFDRWWSHFIFSSISVHIYLQHNAMDMIIAAPNKKCKALLYSTLFTTTAHCRPFPLMNFMMQKEIQHSHCHVQKNINSKKREVL